MDKCSTAVFFSILAAVSCLPDRASAYHINTTERGARIRWSEDAIGVRMDPAFRQMLAAGEAPAAMEVAVEAWRGFQGVPDLVLKEGEPLEPGHHGDASSNGIYLLNDWPYEVDKLAITVVTYELDSGRLLDADVLINPHVPFGVLPEEEEAAAEHEAPVAYDLPAVLTHEAGHMLGLGETDADPEATMWPYAGMGDTHQRTLADDDEAGVLEAYKGPAPVPAMGCGGMSVSGRRATPPSWLVLLGVGLSLAALRLLRAHTRRRGATIMAGLSMLVLAAPLGGGDASRENGREGLALQVEQHGTTLELRDATPQARLRRVLGDTEHLRVGRLARLGARMQDGFIMTDYELRTDDEVEHISLPGGTLDGIGQRVGQLDAPPSDAEVVVGHGPRGEARWAFHHEGSAFGGWLGEGPAVRLAQ